MKNKITCIGILFLFIPVLLSADLEPRHYEPLGNFSIIPPAGWNVTEYPGLKFHIFMGLNPDGFIPNLVFVDENFSGNMNAYIEANMQSLIFFVPDFVTLSRSSFITDSGISGEQIHINNTQHGNFLRQIFYFFLIEDGRYLVITATVPEFAAEDYIPIFDACIRTFEFIN